MTHFSETAIQLPVYTDVITGGKVIQERLANFNDVCVLILPRPPQGQRSNPVETIQSLMGRVAGRLGPQATLITIGAPVDLVHAHTSLASSMQYQLWIAIKRTAPKVFEDSSALPEHHFGALVHTKYRGALQHTKTRIAYTFCPACDKTTKDYGGKKHTYHSAGTLISDVWRDIAADPAGDLSEVIARFADLFAVPTYTRLLVLDGRVFQADRFVTDSAGQYSIQALPFHFTPTETLQSRLVMGDVLEELGRLPDNSVDFAFADPPYNLKKGYNDYSDDRSITEYFVWCDTWMSELARVLRPGRTCAILNIPLWAIRHFLHLEKTLQFQNWVVWDALSFPVRLIMPAHYSILLFSKGLPRPLPGLVEAVDPDMFSGVSKSFRPLEPLAEGFCLRSACVRTRQMREVDDRGALTDLWWDIHRLKHNSRRVDHPCQLPPQLMYRLISIFTQPGEVVLDCFNGAGTTTLASHQLGRQYVGIELSEKYHAIALARHREITAGLDPFRKEKRHLTEKNSPVERMPEQTYVVPKKTLQLEVRRVARMLGKLPTRDEMIEHGQYPIRYYDDYFASWGEVCAAARHDGMSEERANGKKSERIGQQLSLLE